MPKRVHFVGVCGVGMSAIAIALHKAGWKVRGSDKGFYPPVSTELELAGIEYYAGFHPEHMLEKGKPDLIVLGAASGIDNPEVKTARELNIPIHSYPEILAQYFVKENSLVVAGTWGKTTSSAMLARILEDSKYNPSYFVGGIPAGMPAGALTKASAWSVLEGDEYKSSPTDKRPKFAHYSPTHLLLTSVSWDHADLYPSEDHYFAAFEKLIAGVPERGLIVACIDNPGVAKVLDHAISKVITYSKNDEADYRYIKVGESKEGIRFGIVDTANSYAVDSCLLGGFQAENITGCFAMAKEIGIPVGSILNSIHTFGGIKRRMEKRFANKHITILDDIAHSPEKAKVVLRDLRTIYGNGSKIIAIFEPNSGGRSPEMAVKYTSAFSAADGVIIPRLTKLKIDRTGVLQPMDGKDLTKIIGRAHSNVLYQPNDDVLIQDLANLTTRPLSNVDIGSPSDNPHLLIAFLGSHGFRGMIEQLIEKIKSVRV